MTSSPLPLGELGRTAGAVRGAVPPGLRRRQATVDAVNTDGTVDLILAGADTVVPDVPVLAGYDPRTSDTVWCLADAGDLVVLGAVTEGWQDYTPTWTGASSNPSLGNGTLAGRYRLDGAMLTLAIFLEFGSTTTTGSGLWKFTLPTGLDALAGIYQSGMGTACLDDSTSTWYEGVTVCREGDSTTWRTIVGSSNVGSATPFAWNTGDILAITGQVLVDV